MIQTISFEVQNKYEQMLKASASGTPLPQPLPQARFKNSESTTAAAKPCFEQLSTVNVQPLITEHLDGFAIP